MIKKDKNELKEVIEKARDETNVTIVKLAELLEILRSSVGIYIKNR